MSSQTRCLGALESTKPSRAQAVEDTDDPFAREVALLSQARPALVEGRPAQALGLLDRYAANRWIHYTKANAATAYTFSNRTGEPVSIFIEDIRRRWWIPGDGFPKVHLPGDGG